MCVFLEFLWYGGLVPFKYLCIKIFVGFDLDMKVRFVSKLSNKFPEGTYSERIPILSLKYPERAKVNVDTPIKSLICLNWILVHSSFA